MSSPPENRHEETGAKTLGLDNSKGANDMVAIGPWCASSAGEKHGNIVARGMRCAAKCLQVRHAFGFTA